MQREVTRGAELLAGLLAEDRGRFLAVLGFCIRQVKQLDWLLEIMTVLCLYFHPLRPVPSRGAKVEHLW